MLKMGYVKIIITLNPRAKPTIGLDQPDLPNTFGVGGDDSKLVFSAEISHIRSVSFYDKHSDSCLYGKTHVSAAVQL